MTAKRNPLLDFSAAAPPSPVVEPGLPPLVGADPITPQEAALAAIQTTEDGTGSSSLVPPSETTTAVEPADRRALIGETPKAWPLYLGAGGVFAVIALAPIAFALGFRRGVSPLGNEGFSLFVFTLLAVGPGLVVLLSAYLLHQGRVLAAEARRAKALADAMFTPAALAVAGTAASVDAVRQQILEVSGMADRAVRDLLTMRETLGGEIHRLVEAASSSTQSAREIVAALSREREAIESLSQSLETQAQKIDGTIHRNAQMVAEAADLAETQLREAEAALSARGSEVVAAANQAKEAAKLAGEDVSRQAARLEAAGLGLGEQLQAVEEGLIEQRGALVAAAHGLRADQEDFAVEQESRQAQLVEAIKQSQQGASLIVEQAMRGSAELQGLLEEASHQIAAITERSVIERRALGTFGAEAATAMAEASQIQRESLQREVRGAVETLLTGIEQARQAAEQHAMTAKQRVESLSEAGFAATRMAEDVFESRMREARALIDQSTALVEAAGGRTMEQLGMRVASARDTMAQLEALMSDIDVRTARLPSETLARAQDVRATLEASLADLVASARRVGEETTAIDAAFQERVRRNYEMLSEAARLMGTVTGGASNRTHPQPIERPAPVADRLPPTTPAPVAAKPAAEPVEWTPPRQRLKLTPTASDTEFRHVFEPPAPKLGGDDEQGDVKWKDVLAGMASGESGPDKALADSMVIEVSTMGIDAQALLPDAKVVEAYSLLKSGDLTRGRDLVRRLAPAASRRLVRRLFSDPDLRRRVTNFVTQFGNTLATAGADTGRLLTSDHGRAFLLLDAANSDLA